MNIKKFLITAYLMLQFSTAMYASSQANFNAAFLAFGGGTDLPTEAYNVQSDKGKVSFRSAAKIIASKALNKSTESIIVSKYLTGQTLTAAELTSLTNALAAAQAPAQTAALPQLSDATQANWAAAFAAFGGFAAVQAKTAPATMPNSITSTSATYGDAQVIMQYLSGTPMNATDFTNLQAALTSAQAAQVTTPVTPTAPVVPVTTGQPVTPVSPAQPAALPQLSDATQANWTSAFAAFGGFTAVQAKTAPTTMPNSITSTSAAYGDAQVIVQYLSGTPMNATDSTNLQAALTAAQAAQPVTPVTPPAPAALPQLSDTTQANWATAFAAFGGVTLVQGQNAPATMPNSITSSSAAYGDAQVIVQYLSGVPMNATDSANLQAALTAAAQASQPAPGSNQGNGTPQVFTPASQFAGPGLVGNYFSGSQTATIADPSGQNTTSYTFSNVGPTGIMPNGTQLPQGTVQIGSIFHGGSCSGIVCSMAVSMTNLIGTLTSQTLGTFTPQTSGPAALPQLSDTTQANWTAAFTAFGGVAAVQAKTASPLMGYGITADSTIYRDAQVIKQYLSGAPMNATDSTNLQAALTAAAQLSGPGFVPDNVIRSQPAPDSNPGNGTPQVFTPASQFAGPGFVGNYFSSSQTATIADPSGKNPISYTFNQIQSSSSNARPLELTYIGTFKDPNWKDPGVYCSGCPTGTISLYGNLVLQTSATFYNSVGQDISVQAVVNGTPSSQPSATVKIKYTNTTPPWTSGVVTVTPSPNDVITYNITCPNYPRLTNFAVDSVTYPYGYAIGVDSSSGSPILSPTGLMAAYSVSTTFYNNAGQDISVQALVAGQPTGKAVTIASKDVIGTVSVAALPSQISYVVSSNKYPDAAPVAYNPTNFPYGYQVTATQSPAALSVTGLTAAYVAPKEAPATSGPISRTFYNNTGDTIQVQAIVNKIPRGGLVSIAYQYTDTQPYNFGHVDIVAFPNDPITYQISGNATSITVNYDATNNNGYQIDSLVTNGVRALTSTALLAPYVPKTYTTTFYNASSYAFTIQALVNGQPRQDSVTHQGSQRVDWKDAYPFQKGTVTINGYTTDNVTYQISVDVGHGYFAKTAPYVENNPNEYEMDITGPTDAVVITPKLLTPPYVAKTFAATFYNDASKTIRVQALINGKYRDSNLNKDSVKDIAFDANAAPYTSATVSIDGVSTDQVQFDITIPQTSRGNHFKDPNDPSNFTMTSVPYDATNTFGYQINVDSTNKVIVAGALTAAYITKIYSATFYNDASQTMQIQAFVNGVPRGNPMPINYANSAPFVSGTVKTPALSTDAITYIVSTQGFNSAPISYDPTNTFGYQVNTAPNPNGSGTIVNVTPLTAAYATQTYSTTFYNSCGKDMLIQPCAYGNFRGPSTRIIYGDNATVTVTGFVNDTITYKIFIPDYHNLDNDGLVVPCSSSTTNPMGYQVKVTIHGGTMSITSIGLDKDTKIYSKFFYNDIRDGHQILICPVVAGVQGTPTTVPSKTTKIVSVAASANQTVGYRIFIYGIRDLTNDPLDIAPNDLGSNGYQVDLDGHAIKYTLLTTNPAASSPGATSYNSRSLGRMSSKKTVKKNKRTWSGYNRNKRK